MPHSLHGAEHLPIYVDVKLKGSVSGPLATRSNPAAASSEFTFNRSMRASVFIPRLSARDTDHDVAVVGFKSAMRKLKLRMSSRRALPSVIGYQPDRSLNFE